MKILVADDDRIHRRLLTAALMEWGYEVVLAGDGQAAWEVLRGDEPPRLALLDWLMPGLDGVEVCRRVRTLPTAAPPYLILLTIRDSREAVVAGLESGANDYITKPCDRRELQARVRIGSMVAELQGSLAARVSELEQALAQVRYLRGLLPICCYCHKVREGTDYWERLEAYLSRHSEIHFSHGICPECWDTEVRPQLDNYHPDSPSSTLPADHE